MTEITNTNNTASEARSIETITAEIVAIRGHAARVVLESAVEIGRRLVEAKELLPHGEWGKWLKEKVDFSQDSATRLMNAYKGYASSQGSLFGAELNSAALRNLSITNALLLLKVPEEEREEFAREVDAEHVSSRELERIIRERDEAKEEMIASEKLRAELADKCAGMQLELSSAKTTISDMEREIEELESRPVEVAVREPDPAEVQKRIDAAVKEAKAAADRKQKELKDKLAEAEKRKKELEDEVERQKKAASEAEKKAVAEQAGLVSMEKARLEREVEDLKKKLAMSDAAVASFKVLFDQAQDVLSRMIGALGGVSDAETAGKLREAVTKLLAVYGEKLK